MHGNGRWCVRVPFLSPLAISEANKQKRALESTPADRFSSPTPSWTQRKSIKTKRWYAIKIWTWEAGYVISGNLSAREKTYPRRADLTLEGATCHVAICTSCAFSSPFCLSPRLLLRSSEYEKEENINPKVERRKRNKAGKRKQIN